MKHNLLVEIKRGHLKDRQRQVSFALRAYASLATSADKGAVRDKSKLGANSWQPLDL